MSHFYHTNFIFNFYTLSKQPWIYIYEIHAATHILYLHNDEVCDLILILLAKERYETHVIGIKRCYLLQSHLMEQIRP